MAFEERPQPTDDGAGGIDADLRPLGGRLCFGGVVGVLAGATVGWMSCWLVNATNIAGLASAIGGLLGILGGVGIAFFQARRFPDSVNPDIASFVCIAFALLPAILTLLGATGGVHGKVTGYLALGTAFGIPAGAALVGGLLDRVAEAVFRGQDGPMHG